MGSTLKLPIGIENFEKLRTEGFYYVDKTGLIADLLENWGEVNLFTRPKRFGKSLNMSMLKYFFSYGCDASLFEGLAISQEKGLCERYMGRFPVISITLKDVAAQDLDNAAAMLSAIIGEEAMRFPFLAESSRLSVNEITEYRQLVTLDTSGNAILRTLLEMADEKTKGELEQLVDGKAVTKKIHTELTYRELYDSIDNVWSVLFTTGYLTKRRKTARDTYELVIPNQEIRLLFTEQLFSWFQEEARKDVPALDAFCEAFVNGDPAAIEHRFTAYLRQTISIRDTFVRKEKKENFYHGILLGLLSHRGDWMLSSNAETGEGYSDILIRMRSRSIGIVIEIKYTDGPDLEKGCLEALAQIKEKDYARCLIEDDIDIILSYGIACRRRKCMVRMGTPQ